LIVVGFLAVVGGAVGFVAYDRATAIDRSTPAVVVDQFLQAGLKDQDPARVGLFVCPGWAPTDAISEMPKPAGDNIFISWGDLVSEENGNRATVTLHVEFALLINGSAANDIENWRLHLVRQDGWRVCELEKLGSVNP